jgi:chemotaxis protein CheY-P-specific phosphatase CheC
MNIANAIESAAHKVEVAKCFGIIMTIKNNSQYKENIFKASNILDLYLKKIMHLNIGSIMMKEMSQQAALEVFNKLDSHSSTSLDKLLEKCISTLRIG